MTAERPFHRVDNARAKHAPGTGLGLSLVKELVDKMQGTIELAEADGGGLEATVTLARADS